ncbi:hypothetical protein DUNSADRAFT_8933 [Dunaliella salina]|uniref:Transmembrane protein n=1 Tax=Dunaliella salina TaxID=3046 RepID=A0ABQ7GIK2_DUNSA|nr:hypothetical protein DUNSADRAFT_8933 [Dunaliella salina]|eukprot:KAF5834431.1 hypothetical protein DUNSADRAFT_8933 [Dunaliella salina]
MMFLFASSSNLSAQPASPPGAQTLAPGTPKNQVNPLHPITSYTDMQACERMNTLLQHCPCSHLLHCPDWPPFSMHQPCRRFIVHAAICFIALVGYVVQRVRAWHAARGLKRQVSPDFPVTSKELDPRSSAGSFAALNRQKSAVSSFHEKLFSGSDVESGLENGQSTRFKPSEGGSGRLTAGKEVRMTPRARSSEQLVEPCGRGSGQLVDPGMRGSGQLVVPGVHSSEQLVVPGVRSSEPLVDPGVRSSGQHVVPGARSSSELPVVTRLGHAIAGAEVW